MDDGRLRQHRAEHVAVIPCAICGKQFSTFKLTVDSYKSSQFYRSIASEIRGGKLVLSTTTAHRIGGKNSKRYRTVFAEHAIKYCRGVSVIAERMQVKFECVVVDPPPVEPPPPQPSPAGVLVVRPDDGSLVGPDTDVAGSVGGDKDANEGKTVWVLIKPDGDYFWVQRPAQVSRNRWRAETRFGDPYTEDGHYFQVCAVIDPEIRLKPAEKLRALPNARMVSNLVGVTFKR